MDINKPGEYGYTALHNAVHKGDEDEVRRLINAGADTRLKTAIGQGPVLIAATRDASLAIVRLLVDKGADPNEQDSAPLYHASHAGRDDLVSYLLAKGANPNRQSIGNPIAQAAFMGRRSTALILKNAGADVDAGVRDLEETIAAQKASSPNRDSNPALDKAITLLRDL